MSTKFERDIASVLNRYCKENDSNTPDYILAEYLNRCLITFNLAVQKRAQWYGRMDGPGQK
jgi:hypothetical protein